MSEENETKEEIVEEVKNEAQEVVPKEEFDDLEDRYKRILAEFENHKKRSTKEREGLYNSVLGDIVEVKILLPKTNDRKAEGRIVKIKNRERDTVVGIFEKSRNFGFVVPDDKKIGTDIFNELSS